MTTAMTTTHWSPDPTDVDTLADLLDLMADFPSNDQRARYLLASNWMRDRGAAAAMRRRQAWPVPIPLDWVLEVRRGGESA